jgi:hypothetical protein
VLLDGRLAAGPHAATLDAARLPAGPYIFRLEAGGRMTTQSAVLLK